MHLPEERMPESLRDDPMPGALVPEVLPRIAPGVHELHVVAIGHAENVHRERLDGDGVRGQLVVPREGDGGRIDPQRRGSGGDARGARGGGLTSQLGTREAGRPHLLVVGEAMSDVAQGLLVHRLVLQDGVRREAPLEERIVLPLDIPIGQRGQDRLIGRGGVASDLDPGGPAARDGRHLRRVFRIDPPLEENLEFRVHAAISQAASSRACSRRTPGCAPRRNRWDCAGRWGAPRRTPGARSRTAPASAPGWIGTTRKAPSGRVRR